jgi:hypothetical protein
VAAVLAGLLACEARAAPDFSGVWGMVQHDRLGAPFFIPIEPKLNATGKSVTAAFVAKYDVKNNEANANCVEPGMPTVMWGIGGAAMEIVQQPQRVTLLSELENQSRLEDPAKLKLTGLRPGGPPLKIDGPVLVNDMTMNDPLWYEDKDYKVTVFYRKLDDYALEDNCPEGTWMERLEALAKKGKPAN